MFDKIYKLRFKNYKCFTCSSFEEIDFSKPLNLLIGKNNSGKSTILDLLQYVYLDNKSEERYELHKLIEDGTELQIGYVLPEENTDNLTLSKGIELAWCRAVTHAEYLEFILVQDGCWHPVDINPDNKRLFESGVKSVNRKFSVLNKVCFRRMNADRDIVQEKEKDNLNVKANGDGTTNLIRRFINDADYKENLVEETLLTELNKIMEPDVSFERIRVQQIGEGNSKKWEVFLKEKGQNRYALSQTGSGLKTIILMLVNLYLLPVLPENKKKHFVFAFEELENNLHPALQRRVFNYLCEYADARKNDVRIFLTTHSHVAINIFSKNKNASIHHVFKVNGISVVRQINSYFGNVEILEDLDIQPSDILQANGIIWVEGPSDRIYIKRWLDLLTGGRFKEGQHYQFLYYGGKLLSHYELGGIGGQEDDVTITKGLINILTTNRHAAIVMDSDKRKSFDTINHTKQQVQEEFEKHGFMCWITEGKEIENYLTAKSINGAYEKKDSTEKLEKDIGKYNLFPKYIKVFEKNFSNVKVDFAKKVAPCITENDFRYDLKEQIEKLANNIEMWNKMER
jgi:energy-coupling factor transporter ATP-binding protein EcfA2